MRILMIQPGAAFSVWDVYRGWLRAFLKTGAKVVDFNLADRLEFYATAGRMNSDGEFVQLFDDVEAARLAAKGLEAVCYQFLPDVVFVVSCFYIPLDTLDLMRARGSKVVILHTEEPYEHDRQLERGGHADLNLVNDPTWLDVWRTVGPAEYVPHAYDPAIHHPGPAKPECRSDFAFVGTGYPGRIKFLEAVDWTGVDVALGGNWQGLDDDSKLRKFMAHSIDMCVDNTEAVDLYRATKMSANIYRVEAERPELVDGWACGPREIELAACGVPFLREPRGEGDSTFGMLPTFDGPEDFGEKLRWWLKYEGARLSIAEAARIAVEHRTFENNVKRFLSLLERL